MLTICLYICRIQKCVKGGGGGGRNQVVGVAKKTQKRK